MKLFSVKQEYLEVHLDEKICICSMKKDWIGNITFQDEALNQTYSWKEKQKCICLGFFEVYQKQVNYWELKV